jgi:TrpR family trp operon transcriptional repressor
MAQSEHSQALREIARALAETGDARTILAFLQSLLTPSEAREIAARWELVKRLDRGQSQREIARQLGLSLCKITRGSRELKKKGSPFKAMIGRQEKRKNP